MQTYTHKTRQMLEPNPEAVALDATGSAYTTPNDWAVKLGGLAHLQILEGRLVYDLRLNQDSAAGEANIELKHGSTVIQSETVDLSAGQRLTGVIDVDLTGINGASKLVASLNVTTAADAGTTAEVFAALDLSGPLVVSGC